MNKKRTSYNSNLFKVMKKIIKIQKDLFLLKRYVT